MLVSDYDGTFYINEDDIKKVDTGQPLPFEDNYFNLVFVSLLIHYFS